MIRIIRKLTLFALMLLFSAAIYTSCKDDMEGRLVTTTDDLQMDDYITQKDPSMSAFLEIVDKADFRGTIHVYGTCTFFIPTNSAIEEYLRQNNKSSVADLTVEECVDIVKFHIVTMELPSEEFIDGRLPMATMLAKYITTRTVMSEGIAVIEVNRQGHIIEKDIKVGNGYIHKINAVLSPYPLTCGEVLENLPDAYSLFKTVMANTGWTEVLKENNDSTWFTVFAQSNASLAAAGIHTEADLQTYLEVNSGLSTLSPNGTLPPDSLKWIWAAYHVVRDLYYVADLNGVSMVLPEAPAQSIVIKRKLDTLLLNEYITEMENTPGVPVDKKSEYTDFSCFNGVIVDLVGHITPVKRGAQSVFWEVTEQPELIKNSNYRKATIPISQAEGLAMQDIKWTLVNGQPLQISYDYGSSFDDKNQHSNGDRLAIAWYRLQNATFTLPLLNPGVYNIWMCYRRADVQSRVMGTFYEAGTQFGDNSNQGLKTIGFTEYMQTGLTAEEQISKGWKRYNAKTRQSTMVSQLLGTIEVVTAGRHYLRFDVLDRGRTGQMWLDMIQFIPIENDQLWPRFDMMGNRIFANTPCEEIWPKDIACSADNNLY